MIPQSAFCPLSYSKDIVFEDVIGSLNYARAIFKSVFYTVDTPPVHMTILLTRSYMCFLVLFMSYFT